MKNKNIIMLTLCMLLVCTLAGNVFAEDTAADPLVTESLAARFNEKLAEILPERHGNNFSDEELAELRVYLSLSFTENFENVSYFNNPDWTLELSGYYKDRDADPSAAAHMITFSFPDDLHESLIADVQIAYLNALTSCGPALSFGDVVDIVNSAIEANQSDAGYIQAEIGICKLSLFAYNGRMFYGLERVDK